MPDKSDQPHGSRHDTHRLSKAEYDRLVQGVDEIYFGGTELGDGQKPLTETPVIQCPKHIDLTRCSTEEFIRLADGVDEFFFENRDE